MVTANNFKEYMLKQTNVMECKLKQTKIKILMHCLSDKRWKMQQQKSAVTRAVPFH